MKVSTYEFAPMIGIARQSLRNKERGFTSWTLAELIRIADIMKANNINEHLTVSKDGIEYDVCITKVIDVV